MNETLRILLIEDNADHAALIQRHLAHSSDDDVRMSVAHVSRLESGIELLNGHHFDAILCDLRLHDSGPDETLGRILNAAPEVPVVILSSQDDAAFSVRAVHEGAQDYIVKQYLNRALLTRAILYSIERKRTRMELRRLNEQLEQRVEQRTRFLTLLQEATVIAHQCESVAQACQGSIELICTRMNWRQGRLVSLSRELADSVKLLNIGFPTMPQLRSVEFDSDADPDACDELTTHAVATRRPQCASIAEVQRVTVPISTRDRLFGLFEFEFRQMKNAEPCDELLEVLDRISSQVGRVIERQELQRLVATMTVLEQQRISADLHDGVGYELSGLTWLANSLVLTLTDEASPHLAVVSELRDGLRDALARLRNVLKGLLALDIGADGLCSALSQLAATTTRRSGIRCRLHSTEVSFEVDRFVSSHLFHIAQEAVSNALKHASPNRIDLSLTATDGGIIMTIEDDGIGMPARSVGQSGMGLDIMRHRATLVGGRLSIESPANGGTRIACSVADAECRGGVESRERCLIEKQE